MAVCLKIRQSDARKCTFSAILKWSGVERYNFAMSKGKNDENFIYYLNRLHQPESLGRDESQRLPDRSEERRVGKECGSGGWPDD